MASNAQPLAPFTRIGGMASTVQIQTQVSNPSSVDSMQPVANPAPHTSGFPLLMLAAVFLIIRALEWVKK